MGKDKNGVNLEEIYFFPYLQLYLSLSPGSLVFYTSTSSQKELLSVMPIKIVSIGSEIPQNIGTIVRICTVISANLHLIKSLGFSVYDKYIKRAGLDYSYLLTVTYYNNLEFCFVAMNIDLANS